jgi:Domain of unknown function (DUF4145)
VKRDALKARFQLDEIPRFPCPHCEARLNLVGEVKTYRSAATAWIANQDWSDIGQIEDEFQATLMCESAQCGQVVGMLGTVRYARAEDERGYAATHEVLEPRSFYPAPAIISIPNNTPASVVREIRNAFAIAWIAPDAAVNRIRVGAEYIMDDFGVPNTTGGEQIALNHRIRLFSETGIATKAHADTLRALRHLEDVRGHGTQVDWTMLLDAFEIFEAVLEDLYGDRANMVAAARKRLSEFGKPSAAKAPQANNVPEVAAPQPSRSTSLERGHEDPVRGVPIGGRQWPLGGVRNPLTGEPYASDAEAEAHSAAQAHRAPREPGWSKDVRRLSRM